MSYRMHTLIAAAIFMTAGAIAFAADVGIRPGSGPGMVDGVWLNALSGGQNEIYVNGLTATGTSQATAYQLPGGAALVEFDTVASSTGAALPFCIAGQEFLLYNNGAQTLTVYPSIANNPVTAAQDTINNTTSVTVATHVMEQFGCAKNGVWFAK